MRVAEWRCLRVSGRYLIGTNLITAGPVNGGSRLAAPNLLDYVLKAIRFRQTAPRVSMVRFGRPELKDTATGLGCIATVESVPGAVVTQ